ncbi:MAG: PhnD/SsuA/transferrin family substrate-binding protein [Polyangiaceae bacterium]|nr:PhnD/SsuA/transferrin family substrate-binding protein [Polyangiaceae bacterium]
MTSAKPSRQGRASRIEPLTRLATGGMADIWLARELGAAGLERFVVVKRLLPHLAREPEIVAMFLSEARFVARLAHPNVVQIHDLGQDDEGYFLVMEYVAGCSVRELVLAAAAAHAKLPLPAALSILEQACRGAHAAHELCDPTGQPLGLVHRDISPHNLMIAPSGDVKLLDFGIAKATAASEATRTGTLKGKHGYMSPEQCSAARVDRRSDVFALGIVGWELLTGERLFKRNSDFATMNAIVSGDVRPATAVRSDLPAVFDPVLARALALETEARWQTADALRRALEAAADACGVRPSRDALAASLTELLGARLDERERALRDAARSGAQPDPLALREVLVPSETSEGRPAESTSTVGSDDIATVVQPRARGARAETPVEDDEPRATATVTPWASGADATPRASPRSAATRVETPVTERSPEAPRPTRRRLWLAAVLAVAVAGLVIAIVSVTGTRRDEPAARHGAPAAASSQLPPAGPPLRFVVAPTVKAEVIESELGPFLGWLGRTLDRPIELAIADSYEHTGELLASDRADFGLLPPLLLVATLAREPRLQPLAVRLFDGSRASDGYLLIRDDASLAAASDLRGRSICYVDRTSTTGYLLPRIWMRQAGLDPDKDVAAVVSGDHLAAMRDLGARKCDAAAVYSGAYLTASKDGIAVGRLRVMAITGHVPQDAMVAAPGLPAAEVKRLRDALLGFEPQRDIDAGRIGEMLGISGFAEYQATEFDTIRKAAEHEGLLARPR